METIEIKQKTVALRVNESCIDTPVFTQVKLTGARFFGVAMDNVTIRDANLSDLEIEGAQLGGAYIHNIGLPPAGHPMHRPGEKMRPLRFEDCQLTKSSFTNCDLEGVEITDCNLAGMKINGILVEDLLKKYKG